MRERGNEWRSYRDHFSSLSVFFYLSFEGTTAGTKPPSDSFSSKEKVAVTRDGDQAIRGSWLGRIFLSCSPFARPVYIFHRLEILFARSAAKLSRFEIFMNGSDTPTLDPAARRNKKGRHQRPLRHRVRFATCCQTRRLPVLFRSANLSHSLCPPPIYLRTSFSCSSLRYCLWNSSNEAG